jgi:glycosyltransferase involved in cell wall biosynthesis
MNLISIIIPVRNCENFIFDTLNELKSFKNIEIFLADGRSQDKTLEIVNNFIDDGLNLKVISYGDSGQSDALNKLLQYVKTPFFVWLNGDDLISEKFVQYAQNTIESINASDRKKLVSITTNSIFINQDNKFVKYQFGLKDVSYLVKNGVWFGKFPCRVWNTALVNSVGGLREDLYYSMDFDLLRKQYLAHQNLFTIHSNDFMGAFRLHDDSKTGNPNNTPKVQNEMNNLLGIGIFKSLYIKTISILLRLLNFKYIMYRFFGNYLKINKDIHAKD